MNKLPFVPGDKVLAKGYKYIVIEDGRECKKNEINVSSVNRYSDMFTLIID